MAEIKPIPTSNIAWATSGTKTTPSPAKRATGWVFQESPPYDFFNWLDGEQSIWIAWLESVATRYFETIGEAIDSLDVGRAFCLQPAVAQGFADASNFTGTTTEGGAIACDGLRVFVWDTSDSRLTARRLYDNAVLWTDSPASTGAPNQISTDGACVALAFPEDAGTRDLFIYDADTGALLDSIDYASSFPVAHQAYCASEDNLRKVYFCDGPDLKVWVEGSGVSTLVTVAGNFLAVCRTQDYILTLRNEGLGLTLQLYDLAGSAASPGTVITTSAVAASLAFDGRHAYAVAWKAGADPECYQLNIYGPGLVSGLSLWGGTLLGAGNNAPAVSVLEVDDRYLYTVGPSGVLIVLCKDSGATRHVFAGAASVGACIDGWRIYTTRAGADIVYGFGTSRGTSQWTTVTPLSIPGNVDTGNLIAPFRKLAVPVNKG